MVLYGFLVSLIFYSNILFCTVYRTFTQFTVANKITLRINEVLLVLILRVQNSSRVVL